VKKVYIGFSFIFVYDRMNFMMNFWNVSSGMLRRVFSQKCAVLSEVLDASLHPGDGQHGSTSQKTIFRL
jgi:hypothetical protein